MPRVPSPVDVPGIGGLFLWRPETGQPMRAFAQALLRGASSLTEVEREVIASVVSHENACVYCENSHTAAACVLASDPHVVSRALVDDGLTPKMRALLVVARQVAQSGRAVTDDAIAAARAAGASDTDVHDTVLVAAAFCMFNRYVDGLQAVTPPPGPAYEAVGQRLATQGYLPPTPAR